MKILVFEFATATGLDDPSINAEGQAMLYSILEDLKDFETHHLISSGFETPTSCQSMPVVIQGDLHEWLESNIADYDACLPIAPEENDLLHDLTIIIEKHDVEVLGSNSKAVKLTTNKFDTYNALKDKILGKKINDARMIPLVLKIVILFTMFILISNATTECPEYANATARFAAIRSRCATRHRMMRYATLKPERWSNLTCGFRGMSISVPN